MIQTSSQSSNALRNTIRIMNSDLSEIGVMNLEENYFVTQGAINDFMRANDIDDSNELMESLCTLHNASSIHIIDESAKDTQALLTLLEALNPNEVIAASGSIYTLLTNLIECVMVGIMGKSYDNSASVKSGIKKCDATIHEIDAEIKRIDKNEKDSRLRFSGMYLLNICKKLILAFALPTILPTIFGTLSLPVIIVSVTNLLTSESTSGLVLSFVDYKRLLNEYRTRVVSSKACLEEKLKQKKMER